jgi:hypothetical protein
MLKWRRGCREFSVTMRLFIPDSTPYKHCAGLSHVAGRFDVPQRFQKIHVLKNSRPDGKRGHFSCPSRLTTRTMSLLMELTVAGA